MQYRTLSQRFWLIALLCLHLSAWVSHAGTLNQEKSELGPEIYTKVAKGVFLLQVEDENGTPIGQASAFLVADQLLITNAHVVHRGKVFLKTDLLKLECAVEREDSINDLALLRIPATIAVRPLPLAESDPKEGITIFTVGNPQGLEKTISQGLFTGIRKIAQRDLLQISAPISPGSSGGPVVNVKGEVIGVAIGSLENGQNLNFAVPIKTVQKLLTQSSDSKQTNAAEILARIENLKDEKKNLEYSTESDSPWQRMISQISELYRKAIGQIEDQDLLIKISRDTKWEYQDVSVNAARKAATLPSRLKSAAYVALAEALFTKGSWNSNQNEALTLYREAEASALRGMTGVGTPSTDLLVLLADIQQQVPGKSIEAYSNYKRALEAAQRGNDDPNIAASLRGLFHTSINLKRKNEAAVWLGELVKKGQQYFLDWTIYAAFMNEIGDFAEAGNAYSNAAQAFKTGSSGYRYWCDAAGNYWLADRPDAALEAARKCLELGTAVKDSELRLAYANRLISSILYDRGVYDQAVTHAKQAIALDPNDGLAYYNLSRALTSLQRPDEAVIAAKNAIRLTDGKYSIMHFALGSAYFKLENWEQARLAFEKAAELDKQEPAAAYNVALCYHRRGYFLDAARWYEEVLRRDPNRQDRREIEEQIRLLRR